MNILEEIKTAEQKAGEIRREAQAKARETVRDGEAKAAAAVSKMIESAEADAGARLEEARAAAEKKAEAFLLKSGENDDVLVRAAEENLPAAVAYIVRSAGDVQ